MKLSYFLFVFCLLSKMVLGAQLPDFKIEKSPTWKTNIPLLNQEMDYSNKGSVSYLLLDWQENEIKREYNYRYCIRLNNKDGVQDYSQLHFSFDPSIKKLSLNKIIIHRDGKEISHLRRERVEMLRNEKNADRLIYDGTCTAVVILEDIRVGDVLEYEYTLKGVNPIFKDHFYTHVSQAFNEEVQHLYQEIILPRDKSYQSKILNEGTAPKIISNTDGTHLVWEFKDMTSRFVDSDTPSWYDSYPANEISSFSDWKDVRSFGEKLYPVDIQSPTIDQFISSRKLIKSEKSIIQIIRFIQDEIRYLGLESGINTHSPHSPELVLRQRFGDCKDKSYLLSVLLREIGIEAWPVYVSSKYKGMADQYVASPFAFNHVIVKFIWEGKAYWVDATQSSQQGGLDLLSFPLYGKGLVLDNDSVIWEEIPLRSFNKVEIQEDLYFANDSADVNYDVESIFYGNIASSKRSSNLESSLAESRNGYLDFCAGYYNDLRWRNDSALRFVNSEEHNSFKVSEEYVIPNFWQHTETDSVELYANIYPYNLYEFLKTSSDKLRTMPFSVYYPVSVNYTINLHFPTNKKLGFSSEADSIVNSVFRFYYKTSLNKTKKIYTINYKYEVLKDHVPLSDQKTYFKDYDRLSDRCGEYIQWGVGETQDFILHMPAVYSACVFLLIMFFFQKKLYHYDWPELSAKHTAESFGGWLILPIIGLYFTPPTILLFIYNTGYFNSSFWTLALSGATDPLAMKYALFGELFFNLAIVSFAVLLLILLHQKRATFPRIYVWFRFIVLIGFIVDQFVTVEVLDLGDGDFKDLGREVVIAAIWIPYFLVSKRVKNTFVKALPGKNAKDS